MKINLEQLFKQYVPLLILIGFVMLIATYLGPLGILIMLIAFAAIAYVVYDYIRKQG